MRPNFLCIGTPHSGTTWLHAVLATHPQVAMPLYKKELNYFVHRYHMGEQWYLDQFAKVQPDGVRAVGEVDPLYIYGDLAPKRIAEFGSIDKMIVMFRSPATRIVSNYQSIDRYSPYSDDRAQFMQHHKIEFEQMLVTRYLATYFDVFGRDKFLLLFNEDLRDGIKTVQAKLADFLGIDADGFNEETLGRRVNPAKRPRLKSVYNFARGVRDRYFRNFEYLPTIEAQYPVLRRLLFSEPNPAPDWLMEELRDRKEFINADTRTLEQITGRDLSSWIIA